MSATTTQTDNREGAGIAVRMSQDDTVKIVKVIAYKLDKIGGTKLVYDFVDFFTQKVL